MKASRLAFPTNSPNAGFSAGRVYIDFVDGVPNLRIGAESIFPIGGFWNVIDSTDANLDIDPSSANSYIRKDVGTANTVTILEENGTTIVFLPGTTFRVKCVGAGTCTIIAENTDNDLVTIVGAIPVTQGDIVDVVRIAENEWEVIPVHVAP